LIHLLILFPLLPPLLLHLRLHLLLPPQLLFHQHLLRQLPPLLLEILIRLLHFWRIDCEFSLADEERARVGDAAVEVLAGLLVEEDGGGFFEAVEGVGGEGVGGFVGVD